MGEKAFGAILKIANNDGGGVLTTFAVRWGRVGRLRPLRTSR